MKVYYKAYLVGAENKLERVDGNLEGDFASISANNVPLSISIGSKSTITAWDIIFTPTVSHTGVYIGDVIEFLAASDLCYGSGGWYVAPSLSTVFYAFIH